MGCSFSVYVSYIFNEKTFLVKISSKQQARKEKEEKELINSLYLSLWKGREHEDMQKYSSETLSSKLGPMAAQPIPLCYPGANWDFAKSNFCFKMARGALKSCHPYSHPCSSGSIVSIPCRSELYIQLQPLVQGTQAAPATFPVGLPE